MNKEPNDKSNNMEFEIEDLSFDDSKLDLEIKDVQPKSSNISQVGTKSNAELPSNDTTSLSDQSKSDNLTSDHDDEKLNGNQDLSSSTENFEEQSPEENQEQDSLEPEDGFSDENKQDKKNLKDRYNDAKDNFKEKTDKLKKAPENIKNKINDTKDKIQQVPENLRKKREQAKNAWNNRPKSISDAKDKLKNSNIKDRIKNGAKNRARNMANKAKEGAKDGFKNSDLGKAIDKGKNAIEKGKKAVKGAKKAGKAAVKAGKVAAKVAAKAAQGLLKLFISTLPWSAIVIAVIILLVLIIALVCIFVPGIGGDVNDENNYSQYSETDQKTLEKLQELFSEYPNADGTLALSVVLYPYFDNLHSGNVSGYLVEDTDNAEGEETTEETEEEEEDEDVEQEGDGSDDDPYLYPLRKRKVRRRLRYVLKNLSNSNETDFKNYLKDDYFQNDGGYFWNYDDEILTGYNGYKSLFEAAGSEVPDQLYDLVIEDIYENKDLFINYVFNNATCSTSLNSLPTEGINITDYSFISNLKVQLYENKENFSECAPVGELIDFKDYIMGVVYGEIGVNESTPMEQVKAMMVAAKSYALGRREIKPSDDGVMILNMRDGDADQVYCSIYNGCGSHYGIYDKKENKPKPALSADLQTLLSTAYDETSSTYVYDTSANKTIGPYRSTRKICEGTSACLAQDEAKKFAESGMNYKQILANQYIEKASEDKKASITLLDTTENSLYTAGQTVCTAGASNALRNTVVQYAQNYVGKIPYVLGGKATSKDYDVSNGLDCTGFVAYVLWNTLNDDFYKTGYSVSDFLTKGRILEEGESLKPGDIGILEMPEDLCMINGNKEGCIEGYNHAGIYAGNDYWIDENAGDMNVSYRKYTGFKYVIRLEVLEKADGSTTGTLQSPLDSDGTMNNLQIAVNKLDIPGSSTTLYRSTGEYHGGNDFPCDEGAPIYAADGGIVLYAEDNLSGWEDLGKFVAIENDYNGIKYTTTYQHLSSYNVKVGDAIYKGQQIGTCGNTGESSGSHLHLEIIKGPFSYKSSSSGKKSEKYRVNPYDYLLGSKKGQNYFN